jgi:hypothetical protein
VTTSFTRSELAVVTRHRTPLQVQRWLRTLPYNWRNDTLWTFRNVVRHKTANCIEAALAAATILEQHGDSPLLLDLQSKDKLDHVLFLFRRRGLWGTVGKSRDVGLHGRKPVFRTVRDLAFSYVDPYVDASGRIVGYGVADLGEITRVDWRLSEHNVPSVERFLIRIPHTRLRASDRRHERALRRFRTFSEGDTDRQSPGGPKMHQWL